MPRKYFMPILPMLFVFICNGQVEGGKIKMEQGQVFHVQLTSKGSVTQQAMGQAIDFISEGVVNHSYKVSNASDDFYTVHHETQRLSFRFEGMGNKTSFDSDNKKDLNGQWGEPVKKILDRKYDLVLSASGTVLKANPESFPEAKTDDRLTLVLSMLKDLTSVAEVPKKGEPGFFQMLPAKEPEVGDTWSMESNSATERASTVYTTELISDSTITVKFKTDAKSQVKAEVMGMESTTSMNSITTGTILVNRFTGIMKEKTATSESTGNTEVMGSSIPVNSKMTTHIVVTPG